MKPSKDWWEGNDWLIYDSRHWEIWFTRFPLTRIVFNVQFIMPWKRSSSFNDYSLGWGLFYWGGCFRFKPTKTVATSDQGQ